MANTFKHIGLICKTQSAGAVETLNLIIPLLQNAGYALVLEEHSALAIEVKNVSFPIIGVSQLGERTDMIIVIGGDGMLLNVAAHVLDSQTPILGINRGRLGFLTDIHPTDIQDKLLDVLAGAYTIERRNVLHGQYIQQNETNHAEDIGAALNEIVLYSGAQAQMIQYEIIIDDKFVCCQRADGMIVSTPTGSTAYALSAGGPILKPDLAAMVLVPMFPHTLSSRPLVIGIHSQVKIILSKNNIHAARVSCDGKDRGAIYPGDHIIINKHTHKLPLMHPKDYQYFETLRSKLHWETAYTE